MAAPKHDPLNPYIKERDKPAWTDAELASPPGTLFDEKTPVTPRPEPRIIPATETKRYSDEAQREIDYWSKF